MRALLTALVLLHGVVSRGPVTPVCKVGQPCTEPAVGTVLLFTRNGQVVARVRTGDGGRYAVRLRRGTYLVRLAVQTRIGSGLAPVKVTLAAAPAVRTDFMIDTGIR